VPIQPDLARLVRRYLASTGRRLGDSGPLFRPHDRGVPKRGRSETAMGVRALGYVVQTVAARTGIDGKRVSPHCLRHTFAVRSLRAGHDVESVRKLLGHRSLSTTQRYVDHLELGELRAAVPPLPE